MHKTIAVVTGASSGIGRRFAETLAASGRTFDEVWAIARREDRLLSLAAPCPVRALALDLTDRASLARYAALLERERPDVALLVNASGYGLFGASAISARIVMSPVGTYDASTVTRVLPSMRNQRTNTFPATVGPAGSVPSAMNPARFAAAAGPDCRLRRCHAPCTPSQGCLFRDGRHRVFSSCLPALSFVLIPF